MAATHYQLAQIMYHYAIGEIVGHNGSSPVRFVDNDQSAITKTITTALCKQFARSELYKLIFEMQEPPTEFILAIRSATKNQRKASRK